MCNKKKKIAKKSFTYENCFSKVSYFTEKKLKKSFNLAGRPYFIDFCTGRVVNCKNMNGPNFNFLHLFWLGQRQLCFGPCPGLGISARKTSSLSVSFSMINMFSYTRHFVTQLTNSFHRIATQIRFIMILQGRFIYFVTYSCKMNTFQCA